MLTGTAFGSFTAVIFFNTVIRLINYPVDGPALILVAAEFEPDKKFVVFAAGAQGHIPTIALIDPPAVFQRCTANWAGDFGELGVGKGFSFTVVRSGDGMLQWNGRTGIFL